MSKNKLIISPAAQEDLKSIYLYGKANWGVPRATDYIHRLKAQFKYLIKHPLIGVVRNELLPEIRCLTVNSHNVFYQFQSQQIEIIRVLQGRQSADLHIRR